MQTMEAYNLSENALCASGVSVYILKFKVLVTDSLNTYCICVVMLDINMKYNLQLFDLLESIYLLHIKFIWYVMRARARAYTNENQLNWNDYEIALIYC